MSTARIILIPSSPLEAHAFFNIARQLLTRKVPVELLLFDIHPRLLLEWCQHERIPWTRVPLAYSQRKPRLTPSQRRELAAEISHTFDRITARGPVSALVLGQLEGVLFEASVEVSKREGVPLVYAGTRLENESGGRRRHWVPEVSLFCHCSEKELHESRVESRATTHVQEHIVTGSPLYDLSFSTFQSIKRVGRESRNAAKMLLCLQPPELELASTSVRQVAVLQRLITQLLSSKGHEVLVSVPHGRGGLEIMRLLKQRFGVEVLISNDANTVGLLRWADRVITADKAVAALARSFGKSVHLLSYLKGRFADFQAGEESFEEWLSCPERESSLEVPEVATDGKAALRCAEAILRVCKPPLRGGGDESTPHAAIGSPIGSEDLSTVRPRVVIVSKRNLPGNFAEPLDHTYRTREVHTAVPHIGGDILLDAVHTALQQEDDIVFLATPTTRPEVIHAHVQQLGGRSESRVVGLTSVSFAPGLSPNTFMKALEVSGRLGLLHNPVNPESRGVYWGTSFSRYAVATLRRWPSDTVLASEYAPLAILRREGFELRLVKNCSAAIAQIVSVSEYTSRLYDRGARYGTLLASQIEPLFSLALSGYRNFDAVVRVQLSRRLQDSHGKLLEADQLLKDAEADLKWTEQQLRAVSEAVALAEWGWFTKGLLSAFEAHPSTSSNVV